MTKLPRSISLTHLAVLCAWILAACVTPTATVTPVPTASPPASTAAVVVDDTATPAPTETPAPTPTPVPIELVVCQTDEPTSLFWYADNTTARAGIFDALFDGPIDSVGYSYQAVILDALPSLENGGLGVETVTVNPGDTVVDAAVGATVPLTAGVTLAQPDGTSIVYTGTAPAQTVQISALFRLKAGLLWSDGQPLTAADSLFSFQVASEAQIPVSKYLIDRTASYAAVDEVAIRWTGLPGWQDPQPFLRFWTPLPRHLYGTLPAAQLLSNSEASDHPLGWGPFLMESWTKGERLTLVRNPNYFRAAEGLPRVDRVVFRFGLTPAQIVANLDAGTCDIGTENADFTDQVPALLAARKAGTLAPQFVSTTSFEHLDFGLQAAADYDRTAAQDLVTQADFRHAVAYCLDRQALVDTFLNGLAEVPDVYLSRAHPAYAAGQVTTYPFDPARGQALLDGLGWRDSNGDGLRDSGKRTLSLTYLSGPPESSFRSQLLDWIAAQERANCGIEFRPTLTALDDLYGPWPSGLLFGRRFELAQFPWRAGTEPPCDLYVTAAIPSDSNPGGANDTGYSNPAFDAACQTAQTSLNESVRQASQAEAQVVFSQDLPSLPLYFRFKTGVARPTVGGYMVDPTANSDLWNIEQITR